MSGPPAVSVIIPTKDRPREAARAARNALAQQDVDVEVILVDDGSTPALRPPPDDRVRLIRHDEPAGVAGARNAGCAAAHGEVVAFCDDDDVWAPSKLRLQLDAMASTGSPWSITAAAYVSPEGEILWPHWAPPSGDLLHVLLAANRVPGGGSGVAVRRALFEDAGGFDGGFSGVADWDLWIRLAERAPTATVNDLVVAYCVNPLGMAHAVRSMEMEFERLAEKHRARRAAAGVELDRLAWNRYVGDLHLRAGRPLASLRSHARSARHARTPADLRTASNRISKAAAALVLPAAARRWRARPRRAAASESMAEVRSWLPVAWALGEPA